MLPDSPEGETLPDKSTELLAGVPVEVIEILGEETVEELETLGAVLEMGAALCSLPDPFKEKRKNEQHVDLRALKQDIGEEFYPLVKLKIRGAQVVSDVARRHAPTVSMVVTQHLQSTREAHATSEASLKNVVGTTDRVALVDLSERHNCLPDLREAIELLTQTAAVLPPVQLLQDILQLAELEDNLRYFDILSVGMRKNSRLGEKVSAMEADEIDYGAMVRVESIGRRDKDVRRVHRSNGDIKRDKLYLEKALRHFQVFLKRGSEVFIYITQLVQDSVGWATNRTLQLLEVANERNKSTLEDGLFEAADDIAKAHLVRALGTEDYLSKYAKLTQLASRIPNYKFSPEGRRLFRELQGLPLRRSLLRAANQPDQLTDSNEAIEVDPEFRRVCKEVKNTLKGGGRLDYPNATRIARDLLTLRFDSKGNIRLDPAESGFIIAMLSDKLQLVVGLIQRLNQTSDPQVEEFRRELPDQFTILAHVNLHAVASKLSSIFEDPNQRNLLLNILSAPEISRVRAEITTLHQQLSVPAEQEG